MDGPKGQYAKAVDELKLASQMEVALSYLPEFKDLIPLWLARAEKAVDIKKACRERQRLKEENARDRPDPDGPEGPDSMYEESGETYAFLMVHKFDMHYQRLRAMGYHSMRDLIQHHGGLGQQLIGHL